MLSMPLIFQMAVGKAWVGKTLHSKLSAICTLTFTFTYHPADEAPAEPLMKKRKKAVSNLFDDVLFLGTCWLEDVGKVFRANVSLNIFTLHLITGHCFLEHLHFILFESI